MKLYLASGQEFSGEIHGDKDAEISGEVVFTTGMTGYTETMTDPSYFGQIIVFTFPLIGNYGVPKSNNFSQQKNIIDNFESNKIWIKGLILGEISTIDSHCESFQSLSKWCQENNIPILSGVDTRQITKIIRDNGSIMGAITKNRPSEIIDPLKNRYTPMVSPQKIEILEPENFSGKTIAFIDCGAKHGIFRNFLSRGIRVIVFPFDCNPFDWAKKNKESFQGIFFSNGPGDPITLPETIEIAKQAMQSDLPVFGICLGNQIIALASGAKTIKMPFGNRGLNQPVQDLQNKKCLITSQNHGYVIDEKTQPNYFEVWFRNLNDQTIEGIKHKTKNIFSVQFHPEACSGPEDANYLFDEFIGKL
jgi:carbamoyl-phosphate synthase small subunit